MIGENKSSSNIHQDIKRNYDSDLKKDIKKQGIIAIKLKTYMYYLNSFTDNIFEVII